MGGAARLIENVLNRSPVVFVKLAEDQVGQYDMVRRPTAPPHLCSCQILRLNVGLFAAMGCAQLFTALPTNASNTFFLNYTSMNASLSDVDAIYGAAPRWFLVGDVLSLEDSTLNSSAVLMIIDSELEAVRHPPRATARPPWLHAKWPVPDSPPLPLGPISICHAPCGLFRIRLRFCSRSASVARGSTERSA